MDIKGFRFSKEKYQQRNGWWFVPKQKDNRGATPELIIKLAPGLLKSALETPPCVVAPSNNITRLTRALLLNLNNVEWCRMFSHSSVLNRLSWFNDSEGARFSKLSRASASAQHFHFVSQTLPLCLLGFVGLGHGGRSAFAPKQTWAKLVRSNLGTQRWERFITQKLYNQHFLFSDAFRVLNLIVCQVCLLHQASTPDWTPCCLQRSRWINACLCWASIIINLLHWGWYHDLALASSEEVGHFLLHLPAGHLKGSVQKGSTVQRACRFAVSRATVENMKQWIS